MRPVVVIAALFQLVFCSGLTITQYVIQLSFASTFVIDGTDRIETITSDIPLAVTTHPPDITPLSTSTSTSWWWVREEQYTMDIEVIQLPTGIPTKDYPTAPNYNTPTWKEIGAIETDNHGAGSTFTAFFIQTLTISAASHCKSHWTATEVYSFEAPQIAWPSLIARATASEPVRIQTITEPVYTCGGPCSSSLSYTTFYTTYSYSDLDGYVAGFYTFPPKPILPFPTMAPSYSTDDEDPNARELVPNWHKRTAQNYSESCLEPDSLPPFANSKWDEETERWIERFIPSSMLWTEPVISKTRFYLKVTLLPVLAWFLAGLLESWMWFGRLMRGRGCARRNTIIWSLFTLVLVNEQKRRPDQADREELEKQWKAEVGYWRALWLWRKWGLTAKYPVELLGEFPVVGEAGRRRPGTSPRAVEEGRRGDSPPRGTRTMAVRGGRGGGTPLRRLPSLESEDPPPLYVKDLPEGESVLEDARTSSERST